MGLSMRSTVTALVPAGVMNWLPLPRASRPMVTAPGRTVAATARIARPNRRRADKRHGPRDPPISQINPLAVGVCGGWSMATVKVMGELVGLAAGCSEQLRLTLT